MSGLFLNSTDLWGMPAHFLINRYLDCLGMLRRLSLKNIKKMPYNILDVNREQGRSTFLLVLPTGTGKTEIFIEDIVRLKCENPNLRSLILVPTRKLREQTIERFGRRLPEKLKNLVSADLLSEGDFLVQTTAYMHRHYYKIPPEHFDYIVVDEAHHAPAQGLKNILEHFTPTHLLGCDSNSR